MRSLSDGCSAAAGGGAGGVANLGLTPMWFLVNDMSLSASTF